MLPTSLVRYLGLTAAGFKSLTNARDIPNETAYIDVKIAQTNLDALYPLIARTIDSSSRGHIIVKIGRRSTFTKGPSALAVRKVIVEATNTACVRAD